MSNFLAFAHLKQRLRDALPLLGHPVRLPHDGEHAAANHRRPQRRVDGQQPVGGLQLHGVLVEQVQLNGQIERGRGHDAAHGRRERLDRAVQPGDQIDVHQAQGVQAGGERQRVRRRRRGRSGV